MPSIRRSSYHLLAFVYGSCFLAVRSNAQSECQPCLNGQDPYSDEECHGLVKTAKALLPGTQECRAIQLELFQSECCDEAPRDHCSLCPDGKSFQGGIKVPNFEPEGGDISCIDLSQRESFLDYIFEAGTCDDTLIRRSAAWCGCPGVQRECSLCPNAERPPNPGLIDPVYYGWDCDTFDFVSSYFSAEECTNLVEDIFEFDAPSFCGCSTREIPHVCDLCPAGQMIYKPDLRIGHNEQFSCSELALSTRYIPAEGPCTRVLSTHKENGYIDACCAPINRVPIRLGGSSAMRISGSGMPLTLATMVVAILLR